MSAVVLRADARSLPLADDSVDLVVTSPPYFALRSYQDGGEHYAGQLGSEASPAAYVAALVECTREWMRVLKPSGSLWVNLGDKYNSAASGQNLAGIDDRAVGHARGRNAKRYDGARGQVVGGLRPKSLLGMPWRYALACMDELGLILRAEVIWSKANGLPESVTDRVRRSHEQWFHFTLRPRYYAAVDEIREEHAPKSLTHRGGGQAYGNGQNPDNNWGNPNAKARILDPLGKLPGSVREVPSQPLKVPAHLGVDHFAAFPVAWPLWIIRGWSPAGICTECDEGRRPVVHKVLDLDHMQHRNGSGRRDLLEPDGNQRGINGVDRPNGRTVATITGYTCACPEPTAPTRPAVVLDPFGGTGTTALAASVLGRRGISIDLSADYCRLAQWRTTDPGERARALGLPKPEPVPDEQLSLDLPA